MSDSNLTEYGERFQLANLDRDELGVLTVTLHAGEGPLEQGAASNRELAQMFDDIRRDPENRVVIITGTGGAMTPPMSIEADFGDPRANGLPASRWHPVWRDGMRTIQSIVDIPVPVIAAVNGPVHRHPELPLLSTLSLPLRTPSSATSATCRTS